MQKYFFILIAIFLTACSSFEPAEMLITDVDKDAVTVLPGCESYYNKSDREIIAVTEFANNTSYGNATVTGGHGKGQGVTVYGGNRYSGVAVSASQSNYESVTKELSPHLGEYAQSTVESFLVKLGGVDVVSRNKLDAVLKEQHFQMSIADPDSAVEFGRLLGAKYLVSGSVDNIGVKYNKATDIKTNDDGILGLVVTAVNLYSAITAGWTIETELTINMIDVSTGQIIATQKGRGTAEMGDSPTFAADQVIAGAKKAMTESIKTAAITMASTFELRGYINELRGEKRAALLNIGRIAGLREGNLLEAYELFTRTDFATGRSSCQLIKLPVKLQVSKHLDDDSAWVEVSGSKEALSKLKNGTIVKREK